MKMKADDNKHQLQPDGWIDNYGDFLLNFAMARVYSADAAEDLVQDTLLAAWKARGSFQGKSNEKTWLVSILKRKIIDHYRKNGRSKEVSADQFQSPFHKDGKWEGHWYGEKAPQDWENSTVDPADKDEFYRIMQLCLSLLPEKWSAVFSMKNIDELSTDEICKDIGISSSNLWVILHRARLQLRECLDKNWFNH